MLTNIGCPVLLDKCPLKVKITKNPTKVGTQDLLTIRQLAECGLHGDVFVTASITSRKTSDLG